MTTLGGTLPDDEASGETDGVLTSHTPAAQEQSLTKGHDLAQGDP